MWKNNLNIDGNFMVDFLSCYEGVFEFVKKKLFFGSIIFIFFLFILMLVFVIRGEDFGSFRGSIDFKAPTPFSEDLVDGTDLLINASFLGGINAIVYLFNSSHSQINFSINTSLDGIYVNFSGLDSGVYYFNATAYDRFGNKGSTDTNVVILNDGSADITAPSIIINYLDDIVSDITTSYNFTFRVRDNSDVDNCSLIVDGKVINVLRNVSKISLNGIYNGLFSVSTHSWRINCSDSFGNVGSSSARIFTVIDSNSLYRSRPSGDGGNIRDKDSKNDAGDSFEEEAFFESEFKKVVNRNGVVVEAVEVKVKKKLHIFECGDWGECNVVYDLDDLIEGNFNIRSERIRYCSDGLLEVIRRRTCSVKKLVSIEREEEGLKLYGENNKMVLSIEYLVESRKLNLKFF